MPRRRSSFRFKRRGKVLRLDFKNTQKFRGATFPKISHKLDLRRISMHAKALDSYVNI